MGSTFAGLEVRACLVERAAYRLLSVREHSADTLLLVLSADRASEFAVLRELVRQNPSDLIRCGIDEASGLPFVQMRNIEGMPFLALRKLEDPWKALEPLTNALSSAHDRGLAHGALSPDHVFLQNDGTLAVWGIGVARFVEGVLTEAGAEPNALRWRSTEGLTRREPSPQDDVFSLAMLACEVVFGRPYCDIALYESVADWMRDRHAPLPPPSLRFGPGALPHRFETRFDHWFHRATQRSAASFEHIKDAAAELRTVFAPEPDPASPEVLDRPRSFEELAPISPPLIAANPKGSFYDDGLQSMPRSRTDRKILAFVVLVLVVVAAAAGGWILAGT